MGHQLLDEPDRIKRLVRVLYHMIFKWLGFNPSRRRERVLPGGTSAEDILQEVLKALWEFDPDKVRRSWEALAVAIAYKKTAEALRRAHDDTVSLDWPIGSEDEDGLSLAGQLSDGRTAEDGYLAMEAELRLWELACEHLDQRGAKIFYEIHYLASTREAVGRELGLTGQRVGQIYAQILDRLWGLMQENPRFSDLWDLWDDDDEDGGDTDDTDGDDEEEGRP